MSSGLVANADVSDATGTEGNTLNPTCRLPPEVLAYIFLFCADMLPPKMDWGIPGWLLVTHVCKYWRSVALYYPQLWTNIGNGLTGPWLKMMLARAKSAPLSVKLLRSAVATYNEEISKHVSHIRTLTLLTCDPDDLTLITSSMLTSAANELQFFRLHSTGLSDSWMPEHIFQDHTPQLRSFVLLAIRIPWSAPILTNLTHLVISTLNPGGTYRSVVPPDDGFSRTSFDQFLSALRRMPALETLDLARSIPPRSRPFTADDIVELQRLKILNLAASTIHCVHALECIRIPSSCSLTLTYLGDREIETSTEGGEAQFIAEVISFLHAHANREHARVQSLKLQVYVPHVIFRITMAGPDAANAPTHTLTLPHPQDPDDPRPKPYSSAPADIISTVCHGLPTERVHTLTIGPIAPDCLDWTSQDWIAVFGGCSAAEDVRLVANYTLTQTFCAALALHVPQDAASGGTAFLGNIHRLALDNFHAPYDFHRNKAVGDAFYEAILKDLDARQKFRAIQSLRMKWRGMNDEFASELEKIVPEVEWIEQDKTAYQLLYDIYTGQ